MSVGLRPVGELLDRQHQRLVPRHQHDEERDDPAARDADRLDHGHHDGEPDDDGQAAEVRDGVEAVGRERGRVRVAPVGGAVVDAAQLLVAAHEVGEHGEDEAAGDRDDEGDRQRQPRRDRRIQPGRDEPAEPPVPLDRLLDRDCGGVDGRR